MMVKWLIGAVVLYAGFVALLYLAQRSLQYFPERRRTTPAASGLPEAEELVLDTADGEHVIVWHVPPRGEAPVFLYFHGNGGSLCWRDERFRALIADGSGLVALSYRGYGGSSGRPTEEGPQRGRSSRLCLRRCALSRPAHRPLGRIARFCTRHSTGSGKACRLPGAGGPLHLGGRCRRSALLVRAGTVIHEGSVSFRFARQQG